MADVVGGESYEGPVGHRDRPVALALALVILTLGSINNVLPHERMKAVDPQMTHIHAGSPILVPFTPSGVASTKHKR